MKISVYAITKNESAFVDRMIESVLDADEIVITDTGSTDDTCERIQAWADKNDKVKLRHMHVKPWRFDVARNVSLANVSPDIDVCLCLDLDEIMLPGWREAVERAWTLGETTRGNYHYVWSFKNGEPDCQFLANKLHTRHGYLWHHPVHEVLRAYGQEEVWVNTDARMDHHPDPTKSRGQYLPLLEMSVLEDPHDERNSFYLGREYWFYNEYQKAIEQFARYRDLPTAKWAPERSMSLRISGKCFSILGDFNSALECFKAAVEEFADLRENWLDLAECYYHLANWEECYNAASRAISITVVPLIYLAERECFGFQAHDYLSIAAYQLKRFDVALEHCQKAIALNPTEKRLQDNLAFIKKEMPQAGFLARSEPTKTKISFENGKLVFG